MTDSRAMTPLVVMRIMGWTLAVVGLIFLGLGVATVLPTIRSLGLLTLIGGMMLALGLVACIVGLRWAIRTPSSDELTRWRSRR